MAAKQDGTSPKSVNEILAMRQTDKMGWGNVAKALGYKNLGSVNKSVKATEAGVERFSQIDKTEKAGKPEKLEKIEKVEKIEKPVGIVEMYPGWPCGGAHLPDAYPASDASLRALSFRIGFAMRTP